MIFTRTNRGFGVLEHPTYAPKPGEPLMSEVAQHSSRIGDYEDAFDKPGSSFLWIGNNLHLSREEVAQFVKHLQSWLDTGSLELADSTTQVPAEKGGAS